MSTAVTIAGDFKEVVGSYRIETNYPFDCSVRKDLGGLWPFRNWSWITFYDGTVEDCRQYIAWAERIDDGDADLIQHVSDWLARRVGVAPEGRVIKSDRAIHLPKTWRYDFKSALALFPQKSPPPSGVSGEMLVAFVVLIAVVICGFIYHSM